MPSVGSSFLTAQRIAQATVSCPPSLSAVRMVAVIARCSNSLIRTPYAGHLSCRLSFDSIVSFILFFFYIYSTLCYLYFTLLCLFFNFILFPSLTFVLFLFIFSSLFCLFFRFLYFMSCFPFHYQFQLALQFKLRRFFIVFGTNIIRRPNRTPSNVKVVTVLFRHTC
jgi:hypothetical protein